MEVCTFFEIFEKMSNQFNPYEKINFLREFHALPTDCERISVIKSLLKDVNFNTVDQKSETKARELYEKGSAYLVEKNYRIAREFFTRSIAVSLTGSSLSMAYANRSAALKHLGYLEECLLDIERALELDYPEYLQYKLYTRQGQCLRDMGQTKKAMDSFLRAIKSIDLDDLPFDLKGMQRCAVEREMEICHLRESESRWLSMKTEVGSLALSYGENAELPSASDCIAINHSESQGRHLVATRDILPGDVLLIERPYAILLEPTLTWSHCGHCLARCPALLPCSSCAWMMFCSQSCLDAARSYHEFECQRMPSVLNLDFGHLPLITRIIAVAGIEYLRHFLADVSGQHPKEERTKGFNSDGRCVSTDFIPIYHLVTNASLMPKQELLQRCVLATCLLKCLGLDISRSDSDLFGGLVLRLLQSVYLNSHWVPEYYRNDASAPDSMSHKMIGVAVFATLSLTNHSCDPNVFRCTYHGNASALVAYKPILRGDQILDSYGPNFLAMEKNRRQTELKTKYFFQCECEACVMDYPLLRDMKQPIYFSQDENNTLPQELMECMEAVKPYTLKQSTTLTKESLELFIELLLVLHRMDKRLSKLYVACQRTIEKYFFTFGNVIYETKD